MSSPSFIDRIQQAESGGRRFGKDGQILQGPATKYGTAKGEMQVLDRTAMDPGFGVAPAKDASPEERARVGIDYAKALLVKFGGNEVLAAAAYNHGPGNVQKLVAKHGDNWAEHLPQETKGYITKVAGAALGVGSGSVGSKQSSLEGATPAASSLTLPVQVPVGGGGPALDAPVVVAQAAQAPLQPVEMGTLNQANAWQEFLRSMPQARQPVTPADLNFGRVAPMPAMALRPMQNQVPNFQAFSSWRGRAA